MKTSVELEARQCPHWLFGTVFYKCRASRVVDEPNGQPEGREAVTSCDARKWTIRDY